MRNDVHAAVLRIIGVPGIVPRGMSFAARTIISYGFHIGMSAPERNPSVRWIRLRPSLEASRAVNI